MPGRCLVLGSALCLHNDVEAALDLSEFDGVVAAKRAGVVWAGELDAWVTLHPERMHKEAHARAERGYPNAKRIYSHITRGPKEVTHQMNYKFAAQRTSGSSGLFAVKVALLELGYNRIVLCGIPMDKTYGRIDDRSPVWTGAEAFKPAFLDVLEELRPYVRSMSGWTAQQFGLPTREWLAS